MNSTPIRPDTRRAWNQMIKKLGVGGIVTLDHRDVHWLLEIGAAAVAWHAAQGQPVDLVTETKKGKAK